MNWKRIATDRLRALWLVAKSSGGKLTIGNSFVQNYPGDDRAVVLTHTDPATGDFIIETRESK